MTLQMKTIARLYFNQTGDNYTTYNRNALIPPPEEDAKSLRDVYAST